MRIRSLIWLIVACTVVACGGSIAQSGNRVAATAPMPLRPDDEAALVAAVAELLPQATAQVPVCLRLRDSIFEIDVPDRMLAALGPRAMSQRQCPPTYATSIQTPGTKPRPAGYIDPYHVEAWRPRADAQGPFVSAQLWQGTGFTEYRCDLTRHDLVWKATCRITVRGVS